MSGHRLGIDGSGIHVYWRTKKPLVFWLELGPKKTPMLLAGGQQLARLAMKIPPPYGAIVAAVATAEIADVENKRGPNGVWIKFGPIGYMQSRPRTAVNKLRFPSPW